MNAQLPTTPTNGFRIDGYQINGVPGPLCLYIPGGPNFTETWITRLSNAAPANFQVFIVLDDNQDGTYDPSEIIFNTTTTAPIGTNLVGGLSSTIPAGLPGNTNTYIGIFETGVSFNPNDALHSVVLKGKVGTNYELTALVEDDPNFVAPLCPYAQTTHQDIPGVASNVLMVNGQRDLLVDVKENNNGSAVPFTLKRTIFYTTTTNPIPKPYPTNFAVSPAVYVPNSQASPLPNYYDPLQLVYYPSAPVHNEQAFTYRIYYHVVDQDGYLIPLNPGTSAPGIMTVDGQVNAYKSHNIIMCQTNHTNESLNAGVIDYLLQNGLSGGEEGAFGGNNGGEGGEGGENGREGLEASNRVILFPNPSEGTTYMHLELDQASSISWGVYNAQGQQVKSIDNQMAKSGTYHLDLGTQNLPQGLYICRYQIGEKTYQARFMKQ
ncbi:MAG: T9SS type A sorting domain-containing protein [Bacteroidota bacterium]